MTGPFHPSRRDDDTRWPRWVKVMVIAVAIVLLLGLAAMILRGGGHRPMRHGGEPETTSSPRVPTGHVPPQNGHG